MPKTQDFAQSFSESNEKMQNIRENLLVKVPGPDVCESDIEIVF